MKLRPTTFARAVLYLIAAAAIGFFVVLVPELVREELTQRPVSFTLFGFVAGAYAIAVPIFTAIYQAHRLLGYVDQGTAFSLRSVQALARIKYCAMAVAALIIIGSVAAYILTRNVQPPEDAPPIPIIGSVLTLATAVVATFTAVVQRLLQDAIAIKKENDLTV